ncbi:hypothetical protein ACHAXT_011366 [Thalassiosira profunda]
MTPPSSPPPAPAADGNGECSSDGYDRAEAWCRRTIAAGHALMFSLATFHEEISRHSKEFGLSFEALHSLFRNAHVVHMKRSSRSVRNQTMRHVTSYLNGMSIVTLARKCNYPPSMMARLIVENVAVPPEKPHNKREGNAGSGNVATSNSREGGNKSKSTTTPTHVKKFVTEALRHPEKVLGCGSTAILPEYLFSEKKGDVRKEPLLDPFSGLNMHDEIDSENGDSLQPLSRLSREVREAIDSDPMYGPRQDRERHNVGIEYELLLEQTLRSMDVPFETEEDLRARGTAKTPDILLSCPVGVKVRRREPLGRARARNEYSLEDDEEYEWKIICWIDSKALFGDADTHTNSVLPQVETYVHRFGPGLVLYWFGHAPLARLGDSHGDVVILGGNLPDVLLMPTGDFCGRGGKKLFA